MVLAKSEGIVGIGALGSYLKKAKPDFSPKKCGYSGLLQMLKTYNDLLTVSKDNRWVSINPKNKIVKN